MVSSICEQLQCGDEIVKSVNVSTYKFGILNSIKNMKLCENHYEEWLIREIGEYGCDVIKK